MRKIILFLIIIFIFNSEFVHARKLQKRHHIVNKVLADIQKDPDFKNASFGFLAIDAKTGQIISENNPDMALKPASNQKLISTATVLELYGPDYRFDTKLNYTGYIDTINHILHGDIIIKGGGDPTLGSRYFDQTKDNQFLKQWITDIQNLHVDSIVGSVIADARIYSQDIVPVTWSWINMGNYFGAGASGLSIYDNYYTIYFNTDSIVGNRTEIVKTVPEIPYLVFNNEVVADSVMGDNTNIIGAPYCNARYLRGKLPLGRTCFGVKGALPDPAYFAAYELERRLRENGIKIKGQPSSMHLQEIMGMSVVDNQIEISTIYSPPLSEIIKQTNTHSVNLFAEHFLKQCGLKLIGNTETEKDAEAALNFWKEKGMDTQGMAQSDGSGLSQYDAVTPRQMVFLLKYMKKNSLYFDIYYNSFPVAGKEGTLDGMFKGSLAEGNLRAKSGTIDRVKSFTGYVKSSSGREIIFSMIVNNFSCSSKEAKVKLERLMIALSELEK
jgi:D-alanyl-D-alanine carboxypeptidase/D-alanyl-D-alanine-endopeptidase (penicillin-binding protein 4)